MLPRRRWAGDPGLAGLTVTAYDSTTGDALGSHVLTACGGPRAFRGNSSEATSFDDTARIDTLVLERTDGTCVAAGVEVVAVNARGGFVVEAGDSNTASFACEAVDAPIADPMPEHDVLDVVMDYCGD